MEHTKGTRLDAYESTARHRPRLTQRGTAGSKRALLRNHIQLYKSKTWAFMQT